MSSTSPKPAPQTGWNTARSVILCGASVRSLAESAIAAGFHPLCVDFFEDEDLKNLLGSGRGRFVGRINSFEQIPQVIRSVRKSIPLLWAGGLENHTNLLRDISNTRAVIGPDLECVDQLRNPWKLHDRLTKAGIDVPRLATDATAESDCHWLRKSVTSSGGLGVGNNVAAGLTDAASNAGTVQTDVHVMVAPLRNETIDKAEVPAAPRFARSGLQLRDVYLQEYIDGVPMSATFCADESGLHLFGMCLQLTGWPCLGASDFLFCGNVGPVDSGEAVMRKVVAIARVLIECSGLRGVFGLDFILRQGRVWLLEVNPRLTASHMLYELQQPGLLVHRHLAALGWKSARPRRSLESSESRLLVPPSPVSTRLIFWARSDVCIPERFGEQSPFSRKSTLRIADCPQPGSVVRKSSPLCSLHVTACDSESVERQLIAMEEEWREGQSPSVDNLLRIGFSTQAIARQLQLLRQKFERNRA